MQEWLADDATERVQQGTHHGGLASLGLKRKHIKKAIKRSNNSAPGPDGLPYNAWRVLGDLGVNVLFDVFSMMVEDGGDEVMARDYPEFNESLVFFCPKSRWRRRKTVRKFLIRMA